ncbi:zinc-dependent alcohol dehydrogenase family protein [Candidatus Caldatribacterium sp.]|uniref:zinc-dependent alcohol dehydrogenase family protein n=1 Tax=Candidatus Caldatribacterium sp. TaxID=2282143 RepID=UPI002991968D|nr:zinc-dependent alcohol dehydrogenase family protein [Candidatus Caldatribacterium sp.]MDW8081508.1 zinc-dependent alcohol dehydrogenase family protein [Candidatus Calescibacterium sp.]
MRAMVLEKQGTPLVLRDLPVPEPGDGGVLVAVQACGVCHTDLHIVAGELPARRLPIVPGHQIVGKVVQVGRNVSDVACGDLVGTPWLFSVCGECAFCRRGKENLCENARFTGYDVDGGYAEYFLAHRDSVYPLPQGYEVTELAPLLCGGVIGYRAYRTLGLEKGDILALFGFGSSAHLVLQMARFEGHEVFVFTRSPHHRDLARRLGAVFVGDAEEKPPIPFQAAIVFAPSGALIRKALEHLAPGGKVVAAGIYATPIPEIPYELIYKERSVQSVANSTRSDVREFLAVARQYRFMVSTEVYPLGEANTVLEKLQKREIKASAVLVP